MQNFALLEILKKFTKTSLVSRHFIQNCTIISENVVSMAFGYYSKFLQQNFLFRGDVPHAHPSPLRRLYGPTYSTYESRFGTDSPKLMSIRYRFDK